MLMADNSFTKNLQKNVSYFRNEMKKAGFHVLGNPKHPICPVFLGDAKLVYILKKMI